MIGRGMIRRAVVTAVAVLGAARVASAQPAPAPPPWTTDALVAHALATHPALAAAAATVQGAEGSARQVGLWPNPRVDYSAEDLRRGGGPSRAEHTIRFEQPIVLGGRLRLNRDALTYAVEEATASAEAARADLANRVRLRAVEVRWSEAQVTLARRFVAYAEQAEDIARQLFNTGLVDQPDVLRAEAEAEVMRVQLGVAEADRERAWRQLALAVNDPALPRRPLADETPIALERDAVLAALLAGHPGLATGRAVIARSGSAAAQARAERIPDLVVSVGPRYSNDPGRGGEPIGWEPVAGVGLAVPLWNRNQGGMAATAAAAQGATATQAARELAIRSRFEAVWRDYTAATLSVRAYGSVVVPKATAAFEMSLARYREMALAYPLVLTAQRALLEASVAEIDAAADAARAAVLLQGYLLGEGAM